MQRLPSKRGDFTAVLHSLFSSASVECLCWVVVVCRVHVCDSAFSRVVLFCLATQCFRGLLCFASRLSVFAVGRRARPRFRAVLRSDRAIASGLLCPTDEFAGQFCFNFQLLAVSSARSRFRSAPRKGVGPPTAARVCCQWIMDSADSV